MPCVLPLLPGSIWMTSVNMKLKRFVLYRIGIIPLLLGGMGAAFFVRAPVVFVTDDIFTAIYGEERARLKALEASLRLFRRIQVVPIGENGDQEMTAIAAAEAARSPLCAIFPSRYREAAERYTGKKPGVPVKVLEGRNAESGGSSENFTSIRTDTVRDMYAAGRAAAVLAENAPGEILLIQNSWFREQERTAFAAGLRDQGCEKNPLYLPGSDTARTYCGAVLGGPSEVYLQRNLHIPLILFSWMNPAWVPPEAVLIFDDSPWALLVRAVRGTGEGGLPSETFVRAGPLRGALKRAVRGYGMGTNK